MRGISIAFTDAVTNINRDFQGAVRRHFGNHLGGSLSGVYIRIPFTRMSLWAEWRDSHAGWGAQRVSERDVEVFAGRLFVVASKEPH